MWKYIVAWHNSLDDMVLFDIPLWWGVQEIEDLIGDAHWCYIAGPVYYKYLLDGEGSLY